MGAAPAATADSQTQGPIARYEQGIIDRVADFKDPRQEWRRLFSELLGTFFLVLAAAGGGMMGHAFPGVISHTDAVVAPALTVMGIILYMGKVSGAHLNPAVSIAFALRRDFSWRRGTSPSTRRRAAKRCASWRSSSRMCAKAPGRQRDGARVVAAR